MARLLRRNRMDRIEDRLDRVEHRETTAMPMEQARDIGKFVATFSRGRSVLQYYIDILSVIPDKF